jgi:hypothetical protein
MPEERPVATSSGEEEMEDEEVEETLNTPPSKGKARIPVTPKKLKLTTTVHQQNDKPLSQHLKQLETIEGLVSA